MSNGQPLESAAPSLVVLGSAINGDLRHNDEGFGARFAIYTKLDPITGCPVIDARAAGFFAPEHLRILDRQRRAPGGHADITFGIQIWNDYGRNHKAAQSGDAGFGQTNVHTSANPSTRVCDGKREALFDSLEKLVGDEADLYSRALTCPPVPLSPPAGRGSVERPKTTSRDEEEDEEQVQEEDGPGPPILGPVTPPPGVAWSELPGLERVTILRPGLGNTAITFKGKEAVTAAKTASRKPGATADTVFAAVEKVVPIQGRADGKKFESRRDELSGGLNQFGLSLQFFGVGSSPGSPTGLDITFDGVGSRPGNVTGAEFEDDGRLKQAAEDIHELREKARIEFNLGNRKTAEALANAANAREARINDAITARAVEIAKADAERAKAEAERKKK